MSKTGLESLLATGSRLWLDSVDPDLVSKASRQGVTGATSNPVIIEGIIRSGRFDATISGLFAGGRSDEEIAWVLADDLVSAAEKVFMPVYERTAGNDGYVSFELDPLIEDPEAALPFDERVRRYVALGQQWSKGHPNRMIKVPATEAGIAALPPLAEAGVPLNVTLIFTADQYRAARENVLKGFDRLGDKSRAKSVYSIFVSRLDVYAQKHVPGLSAVAAGMLGIANARAIWRENQEFFRKLRLPLAQEIVFASTGTKDPGLSPWKYPAALAGGDIQTNPPATNDAIAGSGAVFTATLGDEMERALAAELAAKVDMRALHQFLMADGVEKFVAPQKSLLARIAACRPGRNS